MRGDTFLNNGIVAGQHKEDRANGDNKVYTRHNEIKRSQSCGPNSSFVYDKILAIGYLCWFILQNNIFPAYERIYFIYGEKMNIYRYLL